jgi:hypothetical protein
MSETQVRGMELPFFAYQLSIAMKTGRDMTDVAQAFYKDYNMATDIKVSKAMLKLYHDDVDPKFYPAFFSTVETKYNNNFDAFVDDLFATSIFADEAKTNEAIKANNVELIKNDIAFKMMQDMFAKYSELAGQAKNFNENLDKGRRLYMKGLMEMQPTKNFYPDANFTMRLTYGKVLGYTGKDAVNYKFNTTLKGVMEKEIPGDFEFDVDPRLKKVYETKDYGQYGNADGTMSVCFLSNNDITGGNSGSPIMNGKGQLIGLAFDGNWEAMSGDIAFEPELQRTINVDVRYVLLILDKVLGAKNLVDELHLVK